MDRKIKFRGRDIKTGKYVFGDFITPWADDQKFPRIRSTRDYYKDQNGNKVADCVYYDVYPNSVSQLIAIDKHGYEIYEGDEVVSLFGQHCYASFRHYDEILKGSITFVAIRFFGGTA